METVALIFHPTPSRTVHLLTVITVVASLLGLINKKPDIPFMIPGPALNTFI
ncbi:hypothetical protein L211DRAFT_841114 [Terfezia boudieri ATCC MYA-4762]|uniref:Uncharacterized protein n=1 Tax=Terfezia boudieri ATCC MYA-4762 TaxID=1051890 RepID=A0A3N4LE36_9PEZI|nr:hypothetical protein L211DRAFT_841114 [Terfezia boudieri ATCC MYA-4762]